MIRLAFLSEAGPIRAEQWASHSWNIFLNINMWISDKLNMCSADSNTELDKRETTMGSSEHKLTYEQIHIND